jgi:oligopeptide/dipeptide ABC transporter ATP-binding protein
MPEVPLLELENLHISRRRPQGADEMLVQNLSLRLERGQSLGLVGESGSGKSLTALAVMNLLPEPELSIPSGTVRFQGQDLRTLSPRAMNELRGSRMAIIVQDALAALNPVRRVRVQMEEVFRFHQRSESRSEKESRMRQCLQRAGLPDPDGVLRSFPHELSGGMRQRLLLAMALLLDPDLLIADEPTTALDVTLQARWVREVKALQREQQLGLLFISHDLALVAELCERIAVLYKGQLIELATTEQLMEQPRHPYTKAMLASLPRVGYAPQPVTQKQQEVPGKQGCPYAAHCPEALPICMEIQAELSGSAEHAVACHAVKKD